MVLKILWPLCTYPVLCNTGKKSVRCPTALSDRPHKGLVIKVTGSAKMSVYLPFLVFFVYVFICTHTQIKDSEWVRLQHVRIEDSKTRV